VINHSEIDIAEIDVLPGNIMNVTIRKGTELSEDKAKRLVKHLDQMLDDSEVLRAGIIDISGITFIDSDAREYLASGQGTSGFTVGLALLSTSFLGKTIGNLFLTLTKGQRSFPIKYFDSPIRAEHWIRTKLREAKELQLKETAA
jgi:hypothetical protein